MIEPLASRLRTARTERGLSQEEVARALGVSRQSVSKWERGEALPSRANRQALAALYGLSSPRRKGDGERGGPTGDSGAVCSRFLRLSTALWLAYFLLLGLFFLLSPQMQSPFGGRILPWKTALLSAALFALHLVLARQIRREARGKAGGRGWSPWVCCTLAAGALLAGQGMLGEQVRQLDDSGLASALNYAQLGQEQFPFLLLRLLLCLLQSALFLLAAAAVSGAPARPLAAKGMASDFPVRLAVLRRARRLSQEELAEGVGVTRQAVSRWERGTARPDTANLARLAQVLGVALGDFLSSAGHPSPPCPGARLFSVGLCAQVLHLLASALTAALQRPLAGWLGLQAEPSPFCIPWIWLGYLAAALALSCLLRRAVWAGRRPFWLAAGLIGCTAAPLLGTLALLVQASALSPFSASLWQNPPLYRSYLVQQPVHWWLLSLFGLAMLAQLLGLALATARCRWPSA
ncbi:helix-turn-helix domain-containing protein [Bittarella massiliensis (ex Durand et al. 2017)]|uniref:helix-turn-helix domain-containing protein n=1 Tax=Bittarella massiliensis (ex Durand et al. 2017) TaxID=1720313 RepID=UPI0034E973EE